MSLFFSFCFHTNGIKAFFALTAVVLYFLLLRYEIPILSGRGAFVSVALVRDSALFGALDKYPRFFVLFKKPDRTVIVLSGFFVCFTEGGFCFVCLCIGAYFRINSLAIISACFKTVSVASICISGG